jgi:hypothetical protein
MWQGRASRFLSIVPTNKKRFSLLTWGGQGVKRKTKLTIILASTIAALLTFAGVAYAADGAVPGDTLYGLDCARQENS